MQNYTIEYRTPKKGETYLFDEEGMVQTAMACSDHRTPKDVLVPIATVWPDKITERREYTADDLDNLPKGACAWDEDGDVWQRGARSAWFMAGDCGISHNPLRDGEVRHLYSAPKN